MGQACSAANPAATDSETYEHHQPLEVQQQQQLPQLAVQHQQQPPATTQAAPAITVGLARTAYGTHRYTHTALRGWARACYPRASDEILDAVPVVTLLPHLDPYLQHLRQRVECGVLQPRYAADLLRRLQYVVRQLWQQPHSLDVSTVLQQLAATLQQFKQQDLLRQQEAQLLLQQTLLVQQQQESLRQPQQVQRVHQAHQAQALLVTSDHAALEQAQTAPRTLELGVATAADGGCRSSGGGAAASAVGAADATAAFIASISAGAGALADAAAVSAQANLQIATQQGHQDTGRGLSSATAAAADAPTAGLASAAVAALAADTQLHDGEEPATHQQQQQPFSASPRASGTITVGRACRGDSNPNFHAALRAWASVCYPDASVEALHKVPVVNLLPGLDSYLQHLRQRVAANELKPNSAMQGLQRLRRWFSQPEHQHQLGGRDISNILDKLRAAQDMYMQKPHNNKGLCSVAGDASVPASTVHQQQQNISTATHAAVEPAPAAQQQLLAPTAAGRHIIEADAADTAASSGQQAVGAVVIADRMAQEEPGGGSGIKSQLAAAHWAAAAQPAMEGAGDLFDMQPMTEFEWEGPADEDDPFDDVLMPELSLDPEYIAAAPSLAVPAAADNLVLASDFMASACQCVQAWGPTGSAAAAAAAAFEEEEKPTADAEAGAQAVLGAAAPSTAATEAGAWTEAAVPVMDMAGALPHAAAATPAPQTLSPCTFEQLKQRLQQQPDQAEGMRGYGMLWSTAQVMYGPTADPAATEVRPLLLLWEDPARLQDCRDSFRVSDYETCTQTLGMLTGLQALLSQPVFWGTLAAEQQLQLLGDVTALADDCRQHLFNHVAQPAAGATNSKLEACEQPAPTDTQAGLQYGLPSKEAPVSATAATATAAAAASELASQASPASPAPIEATSRDAFGSPASTAPQSPPPATPAAPAVPAATTAAAAVGYYSWYVPEICTAAVAAPSPPPPPLPPPATPAVPAAADVVPYSWYVPADDANPSAAAEPRHPDTNVDVFEAQSILLAMCTAEELLTRDELSQLRQYLQQLQGAAVQLSSRAGVQHQQQQRRELDLGLSRFMMSFKEVLTVRDEDCSTADNRKDAVIALLHTAAASIQMSHQAPGGAAEPAAFSSTVSVQLLTTSAVAHLAPSTPSPTQPAAEAAAAVTARGIAGQSPAAATVRPAGCGSTWLAAEGSLQEALQDLMQQQQGGQVDAALRWAVQCTMKLVGDLAVRDHRDVHAKYLLACMEWLQFCRSNLSGRMMPDDVQVALTEILSLAAAWA